MSGWDIYWLLKLDDIRHLLAGIASIGAFLAGAGLIFLPLMSFSTDDKTPKWVFRALIAVAMLAALSGVTKAFLPSTKQMAAIMVIPKVATAENMEAVSADTKEVYGIFKQWLRDKAKEEEK